MSALIVIAVLLALAAVGYSIYLHHKLISVSQVYEDLKGLLGGSDNTPGD